MPSALGPAGTPLLLGRLALVAPLLALAGCAGVGVGVGAGGAGVGMAVSARPSAPVGPATTVEYEGTLLLEGHYAKPGDTRPYRSRQCFATDGRGNVRLDWTTWAEGDSIGSPEAFLVRGEQVWHRDAPDAAWQRLEGERARLARLQTLAGLPMLVLRDTVRMVPQRLLASTIENAPTDVFVSRRDGVVRSLTLSGGRPTAWEERRAHPRLGDVGDRVAWRWDEQRVVPQRVGDQVVQYQFARESHEVPDGLEMTVAERDHQWTLKAELTSASAVAADSLFAIPRAAQPAADGDMRGAPTLFDLGSGLWALDMEDLDTRSLVVEFADHVAVIEAAVGSANGERIVDAVRRRWPSKPIRHALFSHHHPHYAGGLRALIAAGATIHTTPGNAAFVREVAARPFTLAPDRLARAPKALQLETFERRLTLADGANELVAIDIGAGSDHTDEFLVFWFPRQRLVFETEQGWLTSNGELRATRRAAGFLKTLDDEGLAAERLVQSWPMRGNRRELTRAELETLIAKRGGR